MNALMDEYDLEARLGFEATLRRYAFPPATGPEEVTGLRWVLGSPAAHRQEICRTDRALCALLSGDQLTAAYEVEAAGPIGAGLMCLRASVHAQRHLADDGETGRGDGIATPPAGEYLDAVTRCVAIPTSDQMVWTDAATAATRLCRLLVLTPLPAERPCGPLAILAEAMTARSLLARRAFAAAFVAHLAAMLRVRAEAHGSSALDCARRHAALTVAYLEGRQVTFDNGKLCLDRPPDSPKDRECQ